METVYLEQNTTYHFSCPFCGKNYIAENLPGYNFMRKGGHLTKCVYCKKTISILNDYNSINVTSPDS